MAFRATALVGAAFPARMAAAIIVPAVRLFATAEKVFFAEVRKIDRLAKGNRLLHGRVTGQGLVAHLPIGAGETPVKCFEAGGGVLGPVAAALAPAAGATDAKGLEAVAVKFETVGCFAATKCSLGDRQLGDRRVDDHLGGRRGSFFFHLLSIGD